MSFVSVSIASLGTFIPRKGRYEKQRAVAGGYKNRPRRRNAWEAGLWDSDAYSIQAGNNDPIGGGLMITWVCLVIALSLFKVIFKYNDF